VPEASFLASRDQARTRPDGATSARCGRMRSPWEGRRGHAAFSAGRGSAGRNENSQEPHRLGWTLFATVGLRHTRRRPPRGLTPASVLRRNSTATRRDTRFARQARTAPRSAPRCCSARPVLARRRDLASTRAAARVVTDRAAGIGHTRPRRRRRDEYPRRRKGNCRPAVRRSCANRQEREWRLHAAPFHCWPPCLPRKAGPAVLSASTIMRLALTRAVRRQFRQSW
jgi:hypothetical protein